MNSVTVVMSTYNGEKYIEEQINSILAQDGVDIKIYVRDDGSTDNTWAILENLKKKYYGKISLSQGSNVGYRKSFMLALKEAPDSDFYAFSDQDDVWLKNKCLTAVTYLCSNDNVKLYSSAQIMTDKELNKLCIKRFTHMNGQIECHFTRHSLPGCTYVFTEDVKKISTMFDFDNCNDSRMPSHDFTVLSCALALGDIFIDDTPSMLYRRTNESQTPGGGGLKSRIKHEFEVVFKYKNKCSFVAKELIRCAEPVIDKRKRAFLDDVSRSDESLSSRLRLLTNKKMNCGIFVGNLETKLKIILGSY